MLRYHRRRNWMISFPSRGVTTCCTQAKMNIIVKGFFVFISWPSACRSQFPPLAGYNWQNHANNEKQILFLFQVQKSVYERLTVKFDDKKNSSEFNFFWYLEQELESKYRPIESKDRIIADRVFSKTSSSNAVVRKTKTSLGLVFYAIFLFYNLYKS